MDDQTKVLTYSKMEKYKAWKYAEQEVLRTHPTQFASVHILRAAKLQI
jgi:hypothetical protein